MARWMAQVVRPGVSICAAETQTDELCQAVGCETAMVVEAPHGLATDEAGRPFEFLECQFLKHLGILTFRNRFRQAQPEGSENNRGCTQPAGFLLGAAAAAEQRP